MSLSFSLIFNEKVPTERIFILLHIKIKGSEVLKERFKGKLFSITIKCFLLLIVAVWSFMNTKNCLTVLVHLDLYFSSCLCSSSALPLFHPSLCAHSSRSGYGQRQRQRRHRSPGGDHRKRGGACGGAWWQAAKVPWWVTAIFFFLLYGEIVLNPRATFLSLRLVFRHMKDQFLLLINWMLKQSCNNRVS